MDKERLRKALPTVMNYLDRRQQAARNQLPRHLRPLPKRPIVFQMLLNTGIFLTLAYLMLNRDNFMTEAGPAVGMVVCLLLLIYTVMSALQLKQRYQKTPGQRLASINLWLMSLAALMFPLCVAFFLP